MSRSPRPAWHIWAKSSTLARQANDDKSRITFAGTQWALSVGDSGQKGSPCYSAATTRGFPDVRAQCALKAFASRHARNALRASRIAAAESSFKRGLNSGGDRVKMNTAHGDSGSRAVPTRWLAAAVCGRAHFAVDQPADRDRRQLPAPRLSRPGWGPIAVMDRHSTLSRL